MRPERGNVSGPVDDKRSSTQKKRRSLISRSPTPGSVEPREAGPAGSDRLDDDRLPDAFVGVFGPIADATDAPEPAGLGRREPDPGHPHPPERATGTVPAVPSAAATPYGLDAPELVTLPKAAPIGDLETPLYAPRHPARDAPPPEPPGERTLPPTLPPVFEPAPGAAPAIQGGWTAPPPPLRPRTPRPGPSATTVVTGIVAVAIVLVVLILVTAIGGSAREPEPRLAPGTGTAPAALREVAPAPPSPPPAVAPAGGRAIPPPVAPPEAPEGDRRGKLRVGKKKDPGP